MNGLGLDATFDPANGFRAIPSYGWFVAYEQWWAKNWASNFTYGQNAIDLTDTLPGNTYERANYVSANLIWLPVERMGVGLEYLYGFRENKDGQKGENYPHPDGVPVQVLIPNRVEIVTVIEGRARPDDYRRRHKLVGYR